MFRVLAALTAAVCLSAPIAHAQPYPAKTVRVVVTLTPGSPSDVVARLIADQLSKSLNQPFLIENRPGAGGNIAGEYVMRLLPMGTHRYARLIRPSELSRWARAAGLELADLAGLEYDPFSRKARVSGDVSVNYLAHFLRPATAARA